MDSISRASTRAYDGQPWTIDTFCSNSDLHYAPPTVSDLCIFPRRRVSSNYSYPVLFSAFSLIHSFPLRSTRVMWRARVNMQGNQQHVTDIFFVRYPTLDVAAVGACHRCSFSGLACVVRRRRLGVSRPSSARRTRRSCAGGPRWTAHVSTLYRLCHMSSQCLFWPHCQARTMCLLQRA